jgi:hypothetical protein
MGGPAFGELLRVRVEFVGTRSALHMVKSEYFV